MNAVSRSAYSGAPIHGVLSLAPRGWQTGSQAPGLPPVCAFTSASIFSTSARPS